MSTETSAPSRVLLKGSERIADPWTFSESGDLPDGVDMYVPLETLAANAQRFRARNGRLGVLVGTDLRPETLVPLLEGLELVAVQIDKFADGRYYSIARQLRTRHGYTGELRARGDVLADQVFYMQRCGFDAWELAPGQDPDTCLAAQRTFSIKYQPSADEANPHFRQG